MKAIILAAGEGSRLRPLSYTTPKPLIKIFGKSIISHNLEAIYDHVDEIFIVVKYRKKQLKTTLGSHFKGVPLTYIEQGDKKGTGAAILGIPTFQDDVVILNGDSIFHKHDLQKIFSLAGYGALVQKVENPSRYGIFHQSNEGFATQIIEKPKEFVGDLANVGVYKFSNEIFEITQNIPLSPRGEYEITDSINIFVKKHPFKLIEMEHIFIDVGYPWDILKANSYFLDQLTTSQLTGVVEENVTIKGNIILEEGAILKSGTYIEGNVYIGKDTVIGPNAYIRGSSVIGDNCHIGNSVEIKNSALGDRTNVAHLSYIGDSVIGNRVNIGGGSITANLRHDNANIQVPIKGVLTDSGLRKLGVIIGDDTKIGIKTSFYPGRVLENSTTTLPGEIIQ